MSNQNGSLSLSAIVLIMATFFASIAYFLATTSQFTHSRTLEQNLAAAREVSMAVDEALSRRSVCTAAFAGFDFTTTAKGINSRMPTFIRKVHGATAIVRVDYLAQPNSVPLRGKLRFNVFRPSSSGPVDFSVDGNIVYRQTLSMTLEAANVCHTNSPMALSLTAPPNINLANPSSNITPSGTPTGTPVAYTLPGQPIYPVALPAPPPVVIAPIAVGSDGGADGMVAGPGGDGDGGGAGDGGADGGDGDGGDGDGA